MSVYFFINLLTAVVSWLSWNGNFQRAALHHVNTRAGASGILRSRKQASEMTASQVIEDVHNS